ncbi:reticulocalbin-2 isoform X1 [Maniola jurtina]|uniref:reticulocalbin-2 isoform X1 n=1 Tax=Maniola jurtina TaxID=191418 RepID=UPI001E685F26|nr:reticulocalbin-2 isoform X1 [Maniola jurtina]
MAIQYLMSFLLLLTPNILVILLCASVHSHSIDTNEREMDGAYRPRDYEHYNDAGHNVEFDHEAILGSVKEAEEYDRLSPEESRRRLGLLLPKMDLNGDKVIDRVELKKWILNSFINLSKEEAEERMSEADDNRDGIVTWPEYLRDTFGVDAESEIGPEDTGDTGMIMREEKAMWQAADKNEDGDLNFEEFSVFTNPEEHPVMHPFLVNQTMREKDTNNDGVLDFHEYIGDRGAQQDKEWVISERDKFEHELDINRDGVLNAVEVQRWVIPDNSEIAEEEVDHLFASADDDHDDFLSYDEVLRHHDVFVGSEATDYGHDIDRFDDEL